MSWSQSILSGILVLLSLPYPAFAQETKPTTTKPVVTSTTQSPTVTGTAKQIAPVPAPIPTPQPSVPVTGKIPVVIPPPPGAVPGKTIPPPIPPPPPPPPPLPAALRETPNNPLAPPQNMDDLLKLQMTTDIWVAMYFPLSCLDVTSDCILKLQQEAVQNSPVIRELEAKIATVNQKIEEAQTNNKKSIDLSIFEPGLQVFLKQAAIPNSDFDNGIGGAGE